MNTVIKCNVRSNQDAIYNLDETTIENYKLGIETLRSKVSISNDQEKEIQDFNILKKSRPRR